MKKTIAFAAAVVLVPVLPLYAQTVNIPVRCTVPAIPGVNTPLIEKGESAGNGYISGDGQEKTSDGRMVKTFYPR